MRWVDIPRMIGFGRRILLMCVFAIALLLTSLPISGGNVYASDATVRWDLIRVDFATGTLRPGGLASARAEDKSKIAFTGSGTFRLKPEDQKATGGGDWTTFDPGGNATASGTYRVTAVVSFQQTAGSLPPGTPDLIANPATARGGLAVLRVQYSDGSRGILVVSCTVNAPPTVFEGVTATKGVVDFWNHEPIAPPAQGNFTLFHVFGEDDLASASR